MATGETTVYGGEAQSMVDCTPEPLLKANPLSVEKSTFEEEATNQTEAESASGGDADSSSGGYVDSDVDLMAGESELETELEDSEEEAPALPADDGHQQKQASAESMALNDAFMALEGMRKANLEVEFGGHAIPGVTLLHEYCTTCLHSLKQKEDEKMQRLSQDADFMSNPNHARRRKWMKQMMTRIRTQKKSPSCLICTSPVCAKHCCKEFKKEKITVCGKCSPLFTMDFVVGTISNDTQEQQRRQCMAHMIDSYDRALLMLRYSAQYIDEIASALENRSRTSDHIGLGSSGVGLMSGFTGVAAVAAQFVAAAAILSPAGPPLIVASILFGGCAAATSAGTETINYYSEPNQLACKIIALHDLVRSLLGVTSVLKDAITRGHIDPRHYTEMGPTKKRSTYWKSRLPQPARPAVETVQEEKEEEVVFGDTETTDNQQESPPLSPTEKAKTAAEQLYEKLFESVAQDVAAEPAAAADVKAAENANTDLAVDDKPQPAKTEETQYSLADIDDDEEEPQPAETDKPEPVQTQSSLADIDDDDDEAKPQTEKSEPEQTQYSLADIDDDDEEQPADQEKQDTETTVTANTSFESEEDPAEASPKVGEVQSTAAVLVNATFNAEAEAQETNGEGKPKSTAITIAPSHKRSAISRAMTNSMKIAQFASIACVMLSAATIVMETKNLRDTLESLRKGSPCEKAGMLRKIKEEIDDLPDTRVVSEGCEEYLRAFAKKGDETTKEE